MCFTMRVYHCVRKQYSSASIYLSTMCMYFPCQRGSVRLASAAPAAPTAKMRSVYCVSLCVSLCVCHCHCVSLCVLLHETYSLKCSQSCALYGTLEFDSGILFKQCWTMAVLSKSMPRVPRIYTEATESMPLHLPKRRHSLHAN